MNIRYLVGHAAASFKTWMLSRQWFPLLRSYALGQDWVYDICRIRGRRDATVIFDVGANIGQTSSHLLRYFPKVRVDAFELSSATSRELTRRLAAHPNAKVHNKALGAHPGRVRISLQGCSESNSLLFSTTETGTDTEDVEVDTIDAFCATNNLAYIDILKIDAQGSDLDVLRGADAMITAGHVAFVFIEAGFSPKQPDLQAFTPLDTHLKARGFALAGLYEQWRLGDELHSFNALYFHCSIISR